MEKKKAKAGLLEIGWRELVSLPEIGAKKIKAKVDTGAKTSSLHASDYTIFGSAKNRRIRFKIYPNYEKPKVFRWTESKLHKVSTVRSSTGHVTHRPVILTTLQMRDMLWEIELNLIDRKDMGFSMLIGRQALKGKLLVNAGRSFLLTKKVKK